MNQHLPSFYVEEADSVDGIGIDGFPNGHARAPSDVSKFSQGLASPFFPEVDTLLALFKDSSRELIDLRKQVQFSLLVSPTDMVSMVTVMLYSFLKIISD